VPVHGQTGLRTFMYFYYIFSVSRVVFFFVVFYLQ